MRKHLLRGLSLLALTLTAGGGLAWADYLGLDTRADGQGGKTYKDEAATVVFAMSDKNNPNVYTATPADGFSTVAFSSGDCEVTGTTSITMPDGTDTGVKAVKFRPSGETKTLDWVVRPAAGLTFTPVKVMGYVNRCGTDSGNGIVITAHKAGGEAIALGTFTAWRQGKSSSGKDYDAAAVCKYEITLTAEQQAALSGSEGFTLTSAVGVGAAKEGAFGEVTISGTLNGTLADVAKYTLAVAASPAEGGTANAYPASESYIGGDQVKMTASESFGYDFVSWTDKDGKTVSEEPEFTYTVTSDNALTANFKPVATYELRLGVTGGANSYMVSAMPEGTMVAGRRMYEAGTTVEVSASSNPILTFTNWDDGQTSGSVSVAMDGDKSLTAAYAVARDYIAAWDFQLPGGSGRAADFFAADNDAAQLVLRNEAGGQQGWLDKSQLSAGGYEGRPAAVN